MELLLESSLRASVVLLAALAATAALTRRSAAVRHWILAAAVVAAIATPALRFIVPAWHMPASWLAVARETAASIPTSAPRAAEPATVAAPPAMPQELRQVRLAPWIIGLWAIGGFAGLLGLAIGLVRLRKRSSRAEAFGGRPHALLGELTGSAGSGNVRLLRAGSGTPPMTWGWRRAIILLPDEAESWSDDRLRVVLLHELAHIRRGDWATQMIAECMRAVYWFNPVAWLVSARLRAESELACDDLVLASGVDGSAYATQLLDLARAASRSRDATLPAAAMARPSSFERRFRSMLQNDTNRAPMRRSGRIATIAALLATSLAAAAIGTAQTFSSFSGSIFDATNRVVASIQITLVNQETGALYGIQSGPDGRFQFVGLPPGEYQFDARGVGFETLRGLVTVSGQDVERNLQLRVGQLEEAIHIVGSASMPSNPTPRRTDRGARRQPAQLQCADSGAGGQITPPRKLVNVNPVYPEAARVAGATGTVVLEVLIGPDGRVHEVEVAENPDQALVQATIEAVRQWEFSETLLNCVPSEVRMKVTANFTIEQ